MLPGNEFLGYSSENYFTETTFYALSAGGIKISKERSRQIKQTDSGGQFSIKSTFVPDLLQLAHNVRQN